MFNHLTLISLLFAHVVVVALLALPAVAVAQAPTPFADERGGAAWRVEVQDLITPSSEGGFWSGVRAWLLGKAAVARPQPGTKFVVSSSAYASSPYQTDSTPCITAAGTRVRHGVVATNFLPMGTILSINGDLYIVEDRMNPRFRGRYIDIWFPSTSQALEFGRRKLEIVIVAYGTPGQSLEEKDIQNAPLFKRATLRFMAAGRSFAYFLRLSPVNRHDVDCTKQ